MTTRVGLEGVVNINTGTLGSPTWLELDLTRDCSYTLEKTLADMSSRASGGWRWKMSALKDFKVDLQIIHDDVDTGLAAIQSAFLSDTTVDLQILDSSGGSGFRAQFEVASFNKGEPLEDAQTWDVSLELAYGSTPTVV